MSTNEYTHTAECAIVRQRAALEQDIAEARATQDPLLDTLLGARVEFYGGGDQEAEGCDCGGYESLIVEAGHGEYTGSAPGVTVDVIWDPNGDDSLSLVDPDADLETEQQAEARFSAKTGLRPGHPMFPHDVDFTWQQVWRIVGSRAGIGAWLNSLILDVSAEPSGDDDTFDYWPSGVRLAQQVAEFVGGTAPANLETVVREVLAGLDGLLDEADLGYPPYPAGWRARIEAEVADMHAHGKTPHGPVPQSDEEWTSLYRDLPRTMHAVWYVLTGRRL